MFPPIFGTSSPPGHLRYISVYIEYLIVQCFFVAVRIT
jgi:hypothetical protein